MRSSDTWKVTAGVGAVTGRSVRAETTDVVGFGGGESAKEHRKGTLLLEVV